MGEGGGSGEALGGITEGFADMSLRGKFLFSKYRKGVKI